MKSHFFQFEEFHISATIGFPLRSLDFIIGAFERARR